MSEPYRLPDKFQTERFVLRRVEVTDAPAIFDRYATDPAVTRFLGWRPHRSVADTTAFLVLAAAQWDEGTGFPVVVSDRQQPEDLFGMFHPQLTGHRISYGYVLRASAWGRGCASEVMRWMVADALAHPAIFRAEAFCDVENHASARVMEKAGMTCEGVLRR